MNILKKDCKNCVQLGKLLEKCPEYQCLRNPSMSLDVDNIYQLTVNCFNDFNNKIMKSMKQQVGGSNDLVGPGPQPSANVFDGTPISNVKDLYVNVGKYMKLHKISHLTEKTLIPYGIILSTLNLPDDLIILNELYPDLIKYLVVNNIIDNLNFDTLVPIGIFINEIDMDNINHIKVDDV